MTIISNVKTTLATVKGIQAVFSDLAIKSSDVDVKKTFHECMMETDAIIYDLQQRVELMKSEEIQYRNS